MVINPQNDLTWTYQQGKLGINLTADDGNNYLLDTSYKVDDLFERPEVNAPFCVRDVSLLAEYQEGLSSFINDEGKVLSISLKGVACQRFVKPAIPYCKFFVSDPEERVDPVKGEIVNIYTTCGGAAYGMVLDEKDADGLTRLILLSPELELLPGRGFSNGMMIRVSPEYVCCFRSLHKRKVYA
ncbi:MAG: hypothetical protein ACI4NE_01980 [Succinivibrio sp.]